MKKHVKSVFKFLGIMLLVGIVIGFITGFVSAFVSPELSKEIKESALLLHGFVGGYLVAKWEGKE